MIAQDYMVVTTADRKRLQRMIDSLRESRSNVGDPYESHLRALEDRLAASALAGETDVDDDIVTMNSRLQLRDLDSGKGRAVTLVYDGDVDPFGEKLSVITPMGMAILGSRAGNVVQWQARRRQRRVRVERILFQPEAAGDFGL